MARRVGRCHRCRAPLPAVSWDDGILPRICESCAVLSDDEEADVDAYDRRRARPWTVRDLHRLIDAARRLARATGPSGPWRKEWNDLIDALDRNARPENG